jgi:hypothetical protein
MKPISDQFSVVFFAGPDRRDELLNAYSSMTDLNTPPSEVLVFFNPFDYHAHDFFLDLADFRNCDIIKFRRYHHLAECWNLAVALTSTPYVILANDDVVHVDPNMLEKIHAKHTEGYKIVHATEASSYFSIHKSLILDVGWWDIRYVHSFEDTDFRLRLELFNIPFFRFDPHLVRHTRSTKGRTQLAWDESSGYFFRKHHIHEILGLDRELSPEERKGWQQTGLLRRLDPRNLSIDPTPSFSPAYEKTIAKEFPWEYKEATRKLQQSHWFREFA